MQYKDNNSALTWLDPPLIIVVLNRVKYFVKTPIDIVIQ
jgi:hypothetical protein